MDYDLQQWIATNIPKNKTEFSREAVELLLQSVWEESRRAHKRQEDRRKEDLHGPHWI